MSMHFAEQRRSLAMKTKTQTPWLPTACGSDHQDMIDVIVFLAAIEVLVKDLLTQVAGE